MPSDSVLEEIKSRIDIVDFVSGYVSLKHAGQNWKGLCPFHSEKTPSFTVSPSKQIYHCFGCNSGGDIFSFLVRYENVTFPEAVSILAKKAGVVLKASRGDAHETGEKELMLNIHKDALSFFQQQLEKNTKALDYLSKRGIGKEVQEFFSIGYAPKTWDALQSYLTRKKYSQDIMKKSGLVTQGQKGVYDTFRDRIIFPIHDLKGDVIAFGGRAISEGDEPKYLNSPETVIFNKRRVLYGLHSAKDAIKKTGQALFMEGYLDVITAHIYGFTNAVAPLGTAFTQEHGKLIKRFVEDVILVFDGDEAGMKAAKNAASILLESSLNVKILSFPDSEDPDSYLRKYGKESFQDLLQTSLSIIEFLMLRKGDKRLLTREAIEIISKIPDSILQGYYVKLLSEKFRINEFFIIEQLKKDTVKDKGKETHTPVKRSGARPLDEIYIIKLLLQLPEKIDEAASLLTEGHFKDAQMTAIFNRIKEGVTDFNDLLAKCEGEEKALLTEISFREDFEHPEKVFNDCMKRIRENRRKIVLQELQYKIREAEAKKDLALLKELQAEQHRILSTKA